MYSSGAMRNGISSHGYFVDLDLIRIESPFKVGRIRQRPVNPYVRQVQQLTFFAGACHPIEHISNARGAKISRAWRWQCESCLQQCRLAAISIGDELKKVFFRMTLARDKIFS